MSEDTVFLIIGYISSIVIVLLSSYFLLFSRRKTKNEVRPISTTSDNDWSSLYKCDPDKSPITNDSQELKNVFDVKQNHPILENVTTKSCGEDDKPFKSSYYYAHNNPKSSGGYRDGLKAEDYVMNKPKLLKKTIKEKENPAAATSTQAAVMMKNDSLAINKYLWDDDGNPDGVARIIIDSLPSLKERNKPSYISWQEAGIISKDDVQAKVGGVWKNGLIVQIRSKVIDTNDSSVPKRFHLIIPRMYGEIEDLKVIIKTKKLIIKLSKKKTKDNLKAWPQLPSSIIQPAQSMSADLMCQDLFDKS